MPIRTFRGVQAVRFTTAVIVVFFHACYWFNRDAGAATPAPRLELLGDMCVWTFFLISGFVVVHVVDSGREAQWSTFALRRAVRILPLAWTMTAIKVGAAILVPTAMFDGELTPSRIVSSFLLVPARDPGGQFHTLWGVEWTLVFEAAFYAAVTVCIAARVDPLVALTPVLVVVSALAALRPDGGSALWFYADPILLFLAAGMWIARAHRRGRPGMVVLPLVLFTALFATVRVLRDEESAVTAAVVFVLVVGVFGAVTAAERRLGARIPDWIVAGGEASFAIYLTHPLVAQLLPRVLGQIGGSDVPWWIVVGVSIAISVAFGWAVHQWLDAPLGKTLRRRLIRSRPRPEVPSPDADGTPSRSGSDAAGGQVDGRAGRPTRLTDGQVDRRG